ncbi:MAG TPA: zf-HC2 domain-containing protein [Steroidobacteraceae bacterium]|jgi:hypothetical protein|nr:zf-HC2 domain-containing protein [Steroidobacteraceae bacterium]
MNTPNSSSIAEHQDIWELLPWLVNGRLSEADCRRVEAHLRLCSTCRGEYAAQREIYQVIAADTAVEQMPMAGLNKLRQRIETGAPTAAARLSDRSSPAIGRRFRRGAAAAAVLALSLALGIPAAIHMQTQRHGETSPYYTVTAPMVQHPGAVIRAVFAPTVTLSELQGLLDNAHLRIVAGPTEAGVYSLAMTGPQAIDWSLHRLREHGTVRFAEALGPAPPPAPPP